MSRTLHRFSFMLAVCLSVSLACAADNPTSDETGTGTSTGTETGSETGTGGDEPLECEGDMRCNPLDLSDCPEGEMCIFFNTEFQCVPFTGDGSGIAGAPCSTATACNPGLACIQGVFFSDCAGDACCSPNCDVDGPNTCPNADAGEVCDAWSLGDAADACYVNVGVCSTPP